MKLRVKSLVQKYGTANPFHLADKLDLKIIHASLPAHIRGMLAYVLKRKYIILNDSLSHIGQKITICHEIGHSQLHNGYGYYLHTDKSYYIPGRQEQEANEYAIHLLSYSSDIDAAQVMQFLNEKRPDPHEVHSILSQLIDMQ